MNITSLTEYRHRRRANEASAILQALYGAALSVLTIIAIWLLCVGVFSLV